MIQHPCFSVEAWSVRETGLSLDILAQSESVFALSNGHIGWRGNLDEAEPHGLSGSYLNGVHERRALPYAEAGYGYPEQDEEIINVADGKVIRLLVDDEPFDVRYGDLHHHERCLDFRAGVLNRDVEWSSPSGRRIRVKSTRLVSLVHRSVAAICYDVEALDQGVRIVLQSDLIVNEPSQSLSDDPRAAALIETALRSEFHASADTRCELIHATRFSGQIIAAAMDHQIDGPPSTKVHSESFDDLARVTVTVSLEPGEHLRLIKYVSYGWSTQRSKEALRDQVDAALVAVCDTGWEALSSQQADFLTDFWERSDVEIEGDVEIQQAVRFALFHLLGAAARSERRAIPAKGLTGNGYDGHAFWDSETYVLRVLSYTMPEAVAHALRWRNDTLALAYKRAGVLGLQGAVFPWRTITGAECSAYWPAGTAAFHVGADVADAVIRYVHATGDEDFEASVGLELLTATARMWLSLGHYDRAGGFRIDGVTGPDEYSAIADNNVYTNLMAQRNLLAASDAAERHGAASRELHIEASEIAQWRQAARSVVIPFDHTLGIHPQSERFTDHEVWNFAETSPESYPLLLNFPYFDLYRKQVVKQADLVLAMYLRGDAFSVEQKRANFDYYEQLTVRDSSLSACCQSVIASELGYHALAYDYLAEAALMDLDDLEHNTRDGVHMASLAGTWIALVAGLGGMRESADSLTFAPRLPEGIERLAFNVAFRGRRLHVETTPTTTSYSLKTGGDLSLTHFDESFTVTAGPATVFAVSTTTPPRPSPRQPVGREPARRLSDSHRSQETT